MALPVPLCKFSQSSIRDVDVSVPDTYGNTAASISIVQYHEKALKWQQLLIYRSAFNKEDIDTLF